MMCISMLNYFGNTHMDDEYTYDVEHICKPA